MTTYQKDPDAVLDYRWDWSPWLADGETITASQVIVPSGITANSNSNDTTSATVWLAGGSVGETYSVTNRITTSESRIDDRTMHIAVLQR